MQHLFTYNCHCYFAGLTFLRKTDRHRDAETCFEPPMRSTHLAEQVQLTGPENGLNFSF